MKRFYWIEVILLFTNYVLMINKLELLSLISSVLSLILCMIFIKKLNYYRLFLIFIASFISSYLIAESGGLIAIYDFFEIIMLVMALNLALLFEIIIDYDNIYENLKPYCFMLMMSIIFFVAGIGLKDCAIFDILYPYGIFSLFTIIALIFVPYLSTVTLSFLLHN